MSAPTALAVPRALSILSASIAPAPRFSLPLHREFLRTPDGGYQELGSGGFGTVYRVMLDGVQVSAGGRQSPAVAAAADSGCLCGDGVEHLWNGMEGKLLAGRAASDCAQGHRGP